MRPLPGNSAFPGNASSSDGTTDCFTSPTTTPQMSYILADEAAVDSSMPSNCHPSMRTRDPRKHPIYALLGDGPAPSRESTAALSPPPSAPRCAPTLQLREAVPQRPVSASNRYPVRLQTPPPTTTTTTAVSRPMTPVLGEVSGPCSAISSSSSRRNSLAGSLSEYQESFVMSAFCASEASRPLSNYGSEGVQQFIMPTISVPSRRPFTEVGKSLGRLKILVAGKSGLGKTSLIKAITQSCQHIVHVDPTLPVVPASAGLLPLDAHPNDPPICQGTFQITETFASTKPYPPWWKEPAQSSPIPNTGSSVDMILDRNICLIDTPGYQETCRVCYELARLACG
nr:heat shock protein [Colletotrichum truncatum]KAF6784559.1 heat shock protein [Colletotrichum truncatum]